MQNLPVDVVAVISAMCKERGVEAIKLAFYRSSFSDTEVYDVHFIYCYRAAMYQGLRHPDSSVLSCTEVVDGVEFHIQGYELVDQVAQMIARTDDGYTSPAEVIYYATDAGSDLWCNGPHFLETDFGVFIEKTAGTLNLIARSESSLGFIESRYLAQMAEALQLLKDPSSFNRPDGQYRNLQQAVLTCMLRARNVRMMTSPTPQFEFAIKNIPAMIQDEVTYFFKGDNPRRHFSIDLQQYIDRVIELGPQDQSITTGRMEEADIEKEITGIFNELEAMLVPKVAEQ